MTVASYAVNGIIKTWTQIVCRIDAGDLNKIPTQGPMIIISNHVNFLEAPVLYTHLLPRDITALAKIESWDNKLKGFLFNVWKIIPIRRGEADMTAYRASLDALATGKFLVIAPEGTRSYSGKLQTGLPGTAMIAVRSDVPIVPVAFYGAENFWDNFKRFKRTPFNIRVGKPFKLNLQGNSLNKENRQDVMDECMYQLASLLPEEYRGVYSDFSKKTTNYLTFLNGNKA
ncbi:MAG: 1-acyl-sn-glycerol-3-phosphate acyltransferase [Anaerolineaceae bacterium]|nr:1-acyl-sn-glycerol-3-phosphate acyltransferase [Anaerolineaceae bacterium]